MSYRPCYYEYLGKKVKVSYLENGNWEVVGEDNPCNSFSARGSGQRSFVGVKAFSVQTSEDGGKRECMGKLHRRVVVLDS